MKLFCIPYAGGSAQVYSRWKKGLPNHIELIPLELAGRGNRFGEAFYPTLAHAAADAAAFITDSCGSSPFAVFGHSMGSAIAFEAVHQMQKEGLVLPQHLFLSGRSAPHLKNNHETTYHLLPEREFAEQILRLGGSPQELFADPALAALFVPILRADYRLVETYNYEPKPRKIEIPCTVLYGRGDDTIVGDMEEWNIHTSIPCHFAAYDGEHFFIHNHAEEVVGLIERTLTKAGVGS